MPFLVVNNFKISLASSLTQITYHKSQFSAMTQQRRGSFKMLHFVDKATTCEDSNWWAQFYEAC